MNTMQAALIILATLMASGAAAYWQVGQTRRHQLERDCIVRAAHESAERAALIDDLELAWSLPAFDRELDAGCDRLRQAIRDEQQKKGEL